MESILVIAVIMKGMFSLFLLPFVLAGVRVLLMLCKFIYVYWCPTRFPYQMVLVSFNNDTTGVTCGAGTVYPFGVHEFTQKLLVGFVLLDI